jgi:hypothetical protein
VITAYLWTGIAIVGLVCCWINATEATADLRAVETSKANGARRLIARSSRQGEVVRVCVQVIFVAIGVVAIFPRSFSPRFIGDLVQFGLIGGAALITFQSMLAIRTRRRLRAYFENAERKETP